jgi:hypothetical protein
MSWHLQLKVHIASIVFVFMAGRWGGLLGRVRVDSGQVSACGEEREARERPLPVSNMLMTQGLENK